MILWTIQSPRAWSKLQQDGILRARHEYVMEAAWPPAYEWMADRMKHKIGSPPPSVDLPIWAWFQWEGKKRRKPDLRAAGHLDKGEKGVRIEFEHPDGQALLSDFCLWHHVLNYFYLPGSMADGEAFEKELASHGLSYITQKPLPHAGYHDLIVKSWDKIFDLAWTQPDISEPFEKKSIQATIWELGKEQVRNHTYFISR